jgi:hypothetical protein
LESTFFNEIKDLQNKIPKFQNSIGILVGRKLEKLFLVKRKGLKRIGQCDTKQSKYIWVRFKHVRQKAAPLQNAWNLGILE